MNEMTEIDLAAVGASGALGDAGDTLIHAGVRLMEEGTWNQSVTIGTSGASLTTQYSGTWFKGNILVVTGSMLKIVDWVDEMMRG